MICGRQLQGKTWSVILSQSAVCVIVRQNILITIKVFIAAPTGITNWETKWDQSVFFWAAIKKVRRYWLERWPGTILDCCRALLGKRWYLFVLTHGFAQKNVCKCMSVWVCMGLLYCYTPRVCVCVYVFCPSLGIQSRSIFCSFLIFSSIFYSLSSSSLHLSLAPSLFSWASEWGFLSMLHHTLLKTWLAGRPAGVPLGQYELCLVQ